MPELPRPRLVVSKCLGLAACRYNAQTISDAFTQSLLPWVEAVPVCPEVEIGLGVPREPVRLVGPAQGEPRLLQPATGADHTEAMRSFCREFLDGLGEVDGFLLKGRSPSCGPVDVKIYTSTQPGASSRRGAGMFGGAVVERFAQAAVEHEGRARNFLLREHFLTKLFCRARFRQAREQGRLSALTDFHAAHKLLFMAYDQAALRELGRIAANPEDRPAAEVLADYGRRLDQALARNASRGSQVNTLLHAMGYFKDKLAPAEKAHFLEMLERYRQDRAPLSALVAVLQGWIARWGQEYLAGQAYLRPYPLDLLELSDSGKGRDL
jgi:uncharacterized protein YbgA (DUF1722 family)/uncharacterized protein YbbK (DUF523 family)